MGNTSCMSSKTSDVDIPKEDSRLSLTVEQKHAIKDTWRLLTEDDWAHGDRIFLFLFKKYPEYRHNFPFMDANGVLDLSDLAIMELLERHSSQFMSILDKLVGHASIPIPKDWRKQVKAMADLYKEVESNGQVFKALTEAFVDYLQISFPDKVNNYERECWEAFFEDLITQVFPQENEATDQPKSKSGINQEWPSKYNIGKDDSIFDAPSKEALSRSWSSMQNTPMSVKATSRLKTLMGKKDRRYLERESHLGFERRFSNSLRNYDIDKLNIPMPKGFNRNDRTSVTSSLHQSRKASATANRRISMPLTPNMNSKRNTNRESIGTPMSGAMSPARRTLDTWPSISLNTSQDSLPRNRGSWTSIKSRESFETESVFPKSVSEYKNPMEERDSVYNTLFPKETADIKPSTPKHQVVPKNFFREGPNFPKSPSLSKRNEAMNPFQTKTEKLRTQSSALQETKPLVKNKTSSVRFKGQPVTYNYDADEEDVEEYDESPRVRRRRRLRLAEDVLRKERPWIV